MVGWIAPASMTLFRPLRPAVSLAPLIQELLVFGDSLSDGGNARAVLGDGAFPCPPHWNNRRCDGPLWVEHLAARLGLPPLLPSLAGGGNHSFGGARSGAGATPRGLPNLLTQVEGFLGDGRRQELGLEQGGGGGQGQEIPQPDVGTSPRPGEVPAPFRSHNVLVPSTLVVLRAGANDYLDAPPSPATADAVNRHLLTAVNILADRGLRQFLVPSELPWGFCPIELPGAGEPERRALNGLIAQQNSGLRDALEELAARRGLLILQPDFHRLFLEILAAPAAFGFQEVWRPVLAARVVGGGGSPADSAGVPDAPGYLWWDAWGHLTTAFHRVLAGRALTALKAHASVEGPEHGD